MLVRLPLFPAAARLAGAPGLNLALVPRVKGGMLVRRLSEGPAASKTAKPRPVSSPVATKVVATRAHSRGVIVATGGVMLVVGSFAFYWLGALLTANARGLGWRRDRMLIL